MARSRKRTIVILLFAGLCVLTAAKYQAEKRAPLLLGGDIEMVSNQQTQLATKAFLGLYTKVQSRVVLLETSATTAKSRRAVPVTVKSFDRDYPLYGKLKFRDKRHMRTFDRTRRGGPLGAAVNQAFLDALELKIGQRFMVEDTPFVASALITYEPDATDNDQPRVLIKGNAIKPLLVERGLGEGVTYRYRALLPEGGDLDALHAQFNKQFGVTIWTLHDWREKVPPLLRILSWPMLGIALIVTFLLLVITFLPRRDRRYA